MILENLYLETTRECTIECEHCLRGEREHKSMSVETLENTLKHISKIDTLLLSGGEPLLNVNLLEALSSIIEKYGIEVGTIGITTNGTVYSERLVAALEKLKKSCSSLDLVLSSDLFHRLEWRRLGLVDIVAENYQKYKETVGIRKYLDDDSYHRVSIFNKGRASTLTPERLSELRYLYHINYTLTGEEKITRIRTDKENVFGKLYVNVDGFLVDYNMSYSEEDEISSSSFNVNLDPLFRILDSISNKKKALGTYQNN